MKCVILLHLVFPLQAKKQQSLLTRLVQSVQQSTALRYSRSRMLLFVADFVM